LLAAIDPVVIINDAIAMAMAIINLSFAAYKKDS
jgi:hypothetical protein